MDGTYNIEFWEEFFALYRSLPETWERHNHRFRNKKFRNEGYRKLLEKMQEVNPDITMDLLKKKLNNMRTTYRKELKKVQKSKIIDAATKNFYVPSLWYFNHFNFLRDVMQFDSIDASLDDNATDVNDESLNKTASKLSPPQYEYMHTSLDERDDSTVFSETWANIFRKLSPEQQFYANKTILEVLYQGHLGNLNSSSYKMFESDSSDSRFKRSSSPFFASPSPLNGLCAEEPQLTDSCLMNSCSVENDAEFETTKPINPIKNEFQQTLNNIKIEDVPIPSDETNQREYIPSPLFECKPEVSSIDETSNNSHQSNLSESKDSSTSHVVQVKVQRIPLTEKLMDRQIIKHILDCYEMYPILWDKTHPNYKKPPMEKSALEKIAKIVNDNCDNKTMVTVQLLKNKFRNLRILYNREVLRIIQTNGEWIPQLWYFDQMVTMYGQDALCDNNSETQRVNTTESQPQEESTRKKYDAGDLHEMNFDLIEIYRGFPNLWDRKNADFKNQQKRKDSLNIIIEKMKEKWNLDLTLVALQKKIIYLRSIFVREFRKRRSAQVKSRQITETPQPKNCLYFDQLSFLKGTITTDYECEFCSLVFRSENKYKEHKYKHDGILPYVCSTCNKGFTRSVSLKFHKYTHLGVEDRPFGCNYCEARFSSEINAIVHMRRHTRNYVHSCKVCGKLMATSTELKIHMRIHSGEKPYVCETCGKGFRISNGFNKHMKMHRQQRDYKCTICTKAFYLKSDLGAHMKFHLKIRDLSCNVCGKAFTCRKILMQHKKLHNNHKAYVCKICHKGFAQPAGLKCHMKIHKTRRSVLWTERTPVFHTMDQESSTQQEV